MDKIKLSEGLYCSSTDTLSPLGGIIGFILVLFILAAQNLKYIYKFQKFNWKASRPHKTVQTVLFQSEVSQLHQLKSLLRKRSVFTGFLFNCDQPELTLLSQCPDIVHQKCISSQMHNLIVYTEGSHILADIYFTDICTIELENSDQFLPDSWLNVDHREHVAKRDKLILLILSRSTKTSRHSDYLHCLKFCP